MDIETITKLLDAGYTKAEIDGLQASHDAGGTLDENAGKTNTTTSGIEGNAGAENEGEVKTDLAAIVANLTKSVDGLKDTVKAMQDKNAAGASIDKPTKDTIADTMKSFIDTL